MGYQTAAPALDAHQNVAMPPGWKPEWSAEYSRYYYVNVNTKESSWTMPNPLATREPVPTQSPQPQVQASAPVTQKIYMENYPTPPPEVTTGYFPSASVLKQPQQQYHAQSPAPAQQQQPQQPQQQFHHFQQQPTQYAQSLARGQQQQLHVQCAQRSAPIQQQQQQVQLQYSQPQHQQQQYARSPAPILQQQQSQQQYASTPQHVPQQMNYTTPAQSVQQFSPPATLNSGFVSPILPSAPVSHYQQQGFSQSLTPVVYSPQQLNNYAPTFHNQQRDNALPNIHTNAQFNSQLQQASSFGQPPPQQQQQNGYTNQAQWQSQNQMQQSKRSSVIGGSMMGKMSSKFTQFQKSASSSTSSKPSTPSAVNPNGKSSISPNDWKKWGTRAAIGVAAVGALALGVDAMDGGIFDGATGLEDACGGDFSGGGDAFSGGGEAFSGGGFEGGDMADAQAAAEASAAIDANVTDASLALVGEQNASMLADPAGTEYIYDSASGVNALI